MSACDDIRLELGAYSLGLLDEDDRRSVEDHLRSCADCRAQVDELRATSGLLGAITAQDVVDDAEPPDPDTALAAIAAARRRERRRLAGALGGVGILAALALAIGAILVGRSPADPLAPSGPPVALVSAPGVDASGEVRLSSRPWGTQVDLRVDGLPVIEGGEGYAVWLVSTDGRRVPAGTFRPARGPSTSRMRLAGGIAHSEVAAVGVSRAGPVPAPAVLRGSIS